jgi:hypothetical protein
MLSAEDTLPQGSISSRAANISRYFYHFDSSAESSGQKAENTNAPPTPGVTQKVIGFF